MCFRPASAAKSVECPNCGKKFPIVGGVKQKKCPMCKAELKESEPKAEDEAKTTPEK